MLLAIYEIYEEEEFSMDIFEFYKSIGVDSADVLRRLGNEKLIEKYLDRFYRDDTFLLLEKSVRNRDYGTAFRAAHTLKGICLNLELLPLSVLSSELTEILRDYTPDREEKLMETFTRFVEAYRGIIGKMEELRVHGVRL